jgi:hypothetical protein
VLMASILLTWTGSNWGVSLGALGVVAACFLWGLDNNFTRHISAKNPLIIVGIKGLGAGTCSLMIALLLRQPIPGAGFALLAMALGAISYGISIQLFILATRGMGAAHQRLVRHCSPGRRNPFHSAIG